MNSKTLFFLGMSLFGIMAKADVSTVFLRPGSPVNPTNPFMTWLKSKIISNNPAYDFVAFPGTEMTYDNSNPHLLAKTDVSLKEKSSGKAFLFKVVLTSTDKVKGWQFYMDGAGITVWSAKISDLVVFSRSPDQSPTISIFSISDCPPSVGPF